MIVINGSSGGGQMLRTSLALSALTGKLFRMKNIRSSRNEPGLKPQHLACVKASMQICNGYTEGAELGSQEILFIPKKLASKSFEIDISTAGSVTLLLQSILLPSIFGHKTHTITITGGTDTSWSMPVDYFKNVVLPQYYRVCDIDARVLKRGYHPAGGGKIEIKIKPQFSMKEGFDNLLKKLESKAFNLIKQGKLMAIKGVSHASKEFMGRKVAERTASSAKQELIKFNVPVDISIEYVSADCPGSGIVLWAVYALKDDDVDSRNPIRVGADALGALGKRAEDVGKEAALKLCEEMASPVDRHLADNLVPLIALCRPSAILASEITDHVKANIEAVKAFLGDCVEQKENMVFSKKC